MQTMENNLMARKRVIDSIHALTQLLGDNVIVSEKVKVAAEKKLVELIEKI